MAVVTSSRTESHSSVTPSPAPAGRTGRKAPQPAWQAQGNLQLQRLHRKGGDRDGLQTEGRWAQAAADRPVQRAITGARFRNERSGPRDGSNLERARSLATGGAAMASTGEPVQLWDCSEFSQPTCKQNPEGEAVQTRLAPGEPEEKHEEPVQALCDACEAEEADEPVQAMGDSEAAEATEATETAEETEAEADDEAVQARCAACEAEGAAPRQEEPVQEDGSRPSPGRNSTLIHQEARRGLGNASQPLPHADRIQAAFGHHDISQVRAAVGGAAETANRRMGALAFASGDRIAFRQTPDLRLVAHEAAHVVQQREGLALQGNVGQPGDRWERHADSVADAVTAGRSAQALLDQVSPPAAARGGPTAAGEAAAKEPVQGRFTSSAAHLSEAAPTPTEVPALAAEGDGDAAGAGAPPPDDGAAPPGDAAMNAVAEGDEGGAPPPAGGGATAPTSPGPGGGAAAAAAPPSDSAGLSANDATCYDVDHPPKPDNAEKPTSDAPPGKAQAEPQVNFAAWVDEPDKCPPDNAPPQAAPALAQGPAGAGSPALSQQATAATPMAAPGAAAAPKGKAGGAGAPAGGPVAQAAAAPTEGAEAARDAAVADYESTAVGLDTVLARARSLDQGVSFVSGGDNLSREAAIGEVREFLQRAAGQVEVAVAFARAQVPGRLGGMADSTMATIQGAIDTEKTNISARIGQAQAQAFAGAAMARAHVQAGFTTSAATIEKETTAAIAALDTQYKTSTEQVDQKETKGLEDVNARFSKGRERHEAKGPEFATKAVARGQVHASQYERCKGGYKDDGFWDGCLTVRRAKAQQDAACKTAAGYRTTFLQLANERGHSLKDLRKVYRCAVISGAQQVHQTLDDTHERLISSLEKGRAQAMAGLSLVRSQNLAAIDQALAATLRSLAAQEHSQRQGINDAGYIQQLAAEQLAHASAANLARGIAAAMDSLDQALVALRERLATGETPEATLLGQTLAGIENSLGGGMGSLLGTMESGTSAAEAGLARAGTAALGGLADLTASNDELSTQSESGFAEQVSGLMASASQAFGRLTDNHVQKAQKSATEGTDGMRKAVTGFETALASIGERVEAAITTSLQTLERDLTKKLGELDGQIAREAWKAASKEQPAWKKVLAIVLIIVVIIIATAISIVTLGAGASLFAIILVGALVGAVSAGLIQVLNNWASGEDLSQGVLQAMVMGAVGGAIGGALGFAGGALAAGAAAAGARVATQLVITLSADLVAEGLTQTFGYVAFGQKFNWQGFVMAGSMSGVSFRARPSGPRVPSAHAAAPHVPTPAAGRRAAVTQVGAGAAVGLGVEYLTSTISGEKFDPTRAASAAASAAAAARASRMGHGPAPAHEPTGRPSSPLERARKFDPGGVGERLGKHLEAAGGRLAGTPPVVETPLPPRARPEEPTGLPQADTATPPAGTAKETRPSRPASEEPPPTRPGAEEAAGRPIEEPGGAPGRKPIVADTPADLAGPANRMNEPDLIEATTTKQKIGDTEHDFHISRDGPEVCTACNRTLGHIENMLEGLEPGPLRNDIEQLKKLVTDARGRMAMGESGVEMVRDSARIATQFKTLVDNNPALASHLNQPVIEPHLVQSTRSSGGKTTSPHLEELKATVVRTEDLDIRDYRSSSLRRGEEAVYILRDSSGAVLKVGIAESGAGRFSKYLTAANNLDLDIRIEIAVVKPNPGTKLTDIETRLRNRLEGEGHVLPWDNAVRNPGDKLGRLGRGGQGTPFVRKSQEPIAWTLDGKRIPIPETVANLRQQGRTDNEIINWFTKNTTLTEKNVINLISKRFKAQIEAAETALNVRENQ